MGIGRESQGMHSIMGAAACFLCRLLVAVAGLIVLTAASVEGASVDHATLADQASAFFKDYQRPSAIPQPDDNPVTANKLLLGKMLFFDPRLSRSGKESCATCHNPSLGWQDGLAKGVGDRGTVLTRHTPTILNLAWSGPMLWDGRASSLETQAVVPMMSPTEMAGSEEHVLALLRSVATYRDGMAAIFPSEPLSVANAVKLIAVYERSVVSGPAPFDRWVAGDASALSPSATRGFVLFNTKGKCAACHSGWRFTDDGFHDIGLPGNDPGRGQIMPGITVLDHAFKTPTLRNIAQRAPYMHDGSQPTLEAVIDHYDHGFIQRASLSDDIHPLHLAPADKADLIAFLNALTSQDPPVTFPLLPR
jgi:cytochrome c peroxidase